MINTIRKFLKFFKRDILQFQPFLFDLGTSTLRIHIPEKGLIKLPSLIAYHIYKKEYLFYGNEAKELIGKLPKEIEIIYPIKKGVVHNFDALYALLNFILEDEIIKHWREFKIKLPFTQALTGVPYFSTEIEQRASLEVLKKLGFNKVFAVFNLVALGYAIFDNFVEISPTIVLDIGAGKTEGGIVSRGGIVLNKKVEVSGNYLDEKLQNYLYVKYGIIIGKNTAERVKEILLSFDQKDKFTVIKGKALETGLPKQIKINSTEVREALITYFYHITDMIKSLIEESPPEIIEEVSKNGIYLTGGLSNTPGIEKLFKEELKIPVKIAADEKLLLKGLQKISSSPKNLFYASI